MSNELIVPQRPLTEIMQLAEHFAKSGFFSDANTAAKCVVKIMAGGELGFAPMASMTGVSVIEGKPSIGAHLFAAKIKGSDKYDFEILHSTKEVCELEFWERSKTKGGDERKCTVGWFRKPNTVCITIQDATAAGWSLTKEGKLKKNWRCTPEDMLFARAISRGYRRYCPDLSGGCVIYTQDELEDSGNVIDVTPVSVVTSQPPKQEQPAIVDASFTVETSPTQEECVSDEQRQILETLLAETKTDSVKFLTHFKAQAVEVFPLGRFEEARTLLEKKKTKPAPVSSTPVVETLTTEEQAVLSSLSPDVKLAPALGVGSLSEIPRTHFQWVRLMLLGKPDWASVRKELKIKSVLDLGDKIVSATLQKLRQRIDTLVETLKIPAEKFQEGLQKRYEKTASHDLTTEQLVELEARLVETMTKKGAA